MVAGVTSDCAEVHEEAFSYRGKNNLFIFLTQNKNVKLRLIKIQLRLDSNHNDDGSPL